ncbi:hypothetical protein BD770DRAFT_428728 [Pilaira anomala]|nr:hypothetical protein BD770DRAFT_428728 [Pilaira anomala]
MYTVILQFPVLENHKRVYLISFKLISLVYIRDKRIVKASCLRVGNTAATTAVEEQTEAVDRCKRCSQTSNENARSCPCQMNKNYDPHYAETIFFNFICENRQAVGKKAAETIHNPVRPCPDCTKGADMILKLFTLLGSPLYVLLSHFTFVRWKRIYPETLLQNMHRMLQYLEAYNNDNIRTYDEVQVDATLAYELKPDDFINFRDPSLFEATDDEDFKKIQICTRTSNNLDRLSKTILLSLENNQLAFLINVNPTTQEHNTRIIKKFKIIPQKSQQYQYSKLFQTQYVWIS